MDLTGKLLIAPPAVKGNFWYKTAVFVTEHHNQGSVGLTLNKRSELTLSNFGEQLGFNLTMPGYVYMGGPVNVKSLSLLHTNDWACKNTMQINDQFSISSADDILPRLEQGDQPNCWRLFLGMCGWAQGQLEGEILGIPPWQPATSWLTSTANLDLVFGSDGKDQWCTCLDHSGLEFAQNILA